jgi:branched-chain amino acid transport system substrate-binding protein
VDGLILGLGGDTAAKVAADCAQQGFTPALYGVNAAYTPQLAASPAFNGMKFLSGNVNFFDASIPGVAAFQQAMAKYSPQVDLAQMSYFSFYAWLAGELFEAAGAAGDIGPDSTPDDVRKGLYALDGETLNGTAPPLTFSPDGPTVITCNFLLELQNGKLISGAGGQLTCLPPELGQEVTTIATAA